MAMAWYMQQTNYPGTVPISCLAGLGTDDRRSAQPLAPREQLRFTYFLLWDVQRKNPQANPTCPRTTFAQNKKFCPKNVFLGPGLAVVTSPPYTKT
jgi:hypothetical protein